MNKVDFIRLISEKAELTAKDVSKFLDAFEESVTESLAKGEDITLVGFGAFSVVERAARTARNFRTNGSIVVPPSKAVKFKAGQKLKDAVNNKKK